MDQKIGNLTIGQVQYFALNYIATLLILMLVVLAIVGLVSWISKMRKKH